VGELKIRYEPLKEIVVLDYVRFPSVEDLVRFTNVVAGGKAVGIYWTNGIAFIYYPLSPREAVVKSVIEEKKAYWAFLAFAIMPEYQKTVETREKIIAPILDVSSSPLYRKVTEWLKQQEDHMK